MQPVLTFLKIWVHVSLSNHWRQKREHFQEVRSDEETVTVEKVKAKGTVTVVEIEVRADEGAVSLQKKRK